MDIILRVILTISICLIVTPVTEFFCNRWLKKHDKERADYHENYEKILFKIFLGGIIGSSVSVVLFLVFY